MDASSRLGSGSDPNSPHPLYSSLNRRPAPVLEEEYDYEEASPGPSSQSQSQNRPAIHLDTTNLSRRPTQTQNPNDAATALSGGESPTATSPVVPPRRIPTSSYFRAYPKQRRSDAGTGLASPISPGQGSSALPHPLPIGAHTQPTHTHPAPTAQPIHTLLIPARQLITQHLPLPIPSIPPSFPRPLITLPWLYEP